MTLQLFCQYIMFLVPIVGVGYAVAEAHARREDGHITLPQDRGFLLLKHFVTAIILYFTGAFSVLTFSDWLWIVISALAWGMMLYNIISGRRFHSTAIPRFSAYLIGGALLFWWYYEMGAYSLIFTGAE
jgi:hypothetical protein